VEFLNEALLPAEVLEQATVLVENVDPKDVNYVALAMHTNALL
jgi:predicted nucleic acid-binding protein